MSIMYEVMLHVRKRIENCWIDESRSRFDTEISIEDGIVDLPQLVSGQYFIIYGSYLNDGLYKYPATDLNDETSKMSIISIKPPKAFTDLLEEIDDWNDKYGKASEKPFSSESFDGYSYQRATASDGSGVSWKDVFKSRLNVWRML